MFPFPGGELREGRVRGQRFGIARPGARHKRSDQPVKRFRAETASCEARDGFFGHFIAPPADESALTLAEVVSAAVDVTGLPATPTVLQGGEMLEFYAAGPPEAPGDFWIEADKPIDVVEYMTGSMTVNLPDPEGIGDPAMAQLVPVEQFLQRYVILVPTSWVSDVGVFTRQTGTTIEIDGVAIADDAFLPVTAEYEVARVPLADGVHVLEGEAPFSIMVVGMDDDDSYAYLGGGGTTVINPEPEG